MIFEQLTVISNGELRLVRFELVKTPNWRSPSSLPSFPSYFALLMVAFDCRKVSMNRKGCPGRGTGRGRLCAGSCDLKYRDISMCEVYS